MKKTLCILSLTVAILIGFTLAVASTIRQGFITIGTAAAGSFIQTLTPPVSGNFTQTNFNVGTGVISTQNNNSSPVTSITLTQQDPNDTLQIAGLTKSPINAAFTITAAFTAVASTDSVTAGLWLTDGTANNLAFVENSANSFTASVYSNFAGAFVSNAYGVVIAPFPLGPLTWLRIQETASARNYSISPDGINFLQVATESNTAHFTTAKYGFQVESRKNTGGSGSMCVYSFTETTP